MSPSETVTGFLHEALFYADRREFLAGTVPFIRDGVARAEPVLVVLDRAKIELLRSELGRDADRVEFADMAEVGRNPGRIIPRWQRFVDEHLVDGRSARGIGEPLWAGRTPAEVVECQAHETLLNNAFAGGRAWSLLCPYDVSALDEDVVAEARRSHPVLVADGVRRTSADYVADHPSPARLDHPLDPPPEEAPVLPFEADRGALPAARAFVRRAAVACGLQPAVVEHLVLAANEVVTNSVRHGGGQGVVRVWRDGDAVVCEVRDAGRFTSDPLVGRRPPATDQFGGRGLWLVHQLCDLVQVRSTEGNTVVRMRCGPVASEG